MSHTCTTFCYDAEGKHGNISVDTDSSLKALRFAQSIEFQTPVSIYPSNQQLTQDLTDADSIGSAILDESVETLFQRKLDNGTSVGHLSGVFTVLWFNPWLKVKAVWQNKAPADSISLGLNAYFLRYREMSIGPKVSHPTSEARIFIAALMAADKHENDISYTSASWAKLSNIDLEEIKKMEIEFLMGIKFHLRITPKEWQAFRVFGETILFPLVDRLKMVHGL